MVVQEVGMAALEPLDGGLGIMEIRVTQLA